MQYCHANIQQVADNIDDSSHARPLIQPFIIMLSDSECRQHYIYIYLQTVERHPMFYQMWHDVHLQLMIVQALQSEHFTLHTRMKISQHRCLLSVWDIFRTTAYNHFQLRYTYLYLWLQIHTYLAKHEGRQHHTRHLTNNKLRAGHYNWKNILYKGALICCTQNKWVRGIHDIIMHTFYNT